MSTDTSKLEKSPKRWNLPDGYAFASAPVSLVFVESALDRGSRVNIRIQAAAQCPPADLASLGPDLVMITLDAWKGPIGQSADPSPVSAAATADTMKATVDAIRQGDAQLPIMVLLEPGDHFAREVVAAFSAGANEVMEQSIFDQPNGRDVLKAKIIAAVEHRTLRRRPMIRKRAESRCTTNGSPQHDSVDLVGTSEAMLAPLRALALAGRDGFATLIHGESGTGKTLAAMLLHRSSPRGQSQPSVIDCAELAPRAIDEMMFGSDHDAATLSELHSGKTLIVENIDHAPLIVQRRLLRWLRRQAAATSPASATTVGESPGTALVLTCSKPLYECNSQLVDALYYELAAGSVEMPPLRDRGRDIAVLINHFMAMFTGATPVNPLEADHRIGRQAMQWLLRHDWPGNVTQLRAVLQAKLRLGGGVIVDDVLRDDVDEDNAGPAVAAGPAVRSIGSGRQGSKDPIKASADDPLDSLRKSSIWSAMVQQHAETDDGNHTLYGNAVMAVEHGLITSVLEKTGGNLAQSARLLGITRVSLRRKIHALSIPIPGRDAQ